MSVSATSPETNGDSLVKTLFSSAECAADPYPTYHRLREISPVFQSSLGHWVITGHAETDAALRSPAVGKDIRSFIQAQGTPDWESHPSYTRVLDHLIWANPPKHTRQRRLISKGFSAQAVAKMEVKVADFVEELLAPLASEGVHETNILASFAFPLPAAVISELIGVPRADWPGFQRLFRDVTLAMEPRPTAEQLAKADTAALAINEYFDSLIEIRRAHPEDDLISALLQAEDDGDRLTHSELMSLVQFLFGAGFESTTNLIGNGLLALLRHPDQMRALRRDPSLIPGAVEELLRYDASVQLTPRSAVTDTVIGDVEVPAGASIIAVLGAANRDPLRYRDPDALDVQRTGIKPLSFGSGIHFCLGAPLARIEGSMAISGLIRHFDKIELAAEPIWKSSLVLHGLEELKVELTPNSA